MTSDTALVRSPGPRLEEGLVTHIARRPIDLGLAHEQWAGYVQALRDTGWRTIEVPSAADCPDSVFVEDAVVMVRSVAVVSRPGAESRRPETHDVEKVVASLGLPVAHVTAPGTLGGGDVLKVDNVIYVGVGGRTNSDGVVQLRAIAEPLGMTVVAVPVRSVLHLKSAVTALPDGTVIGYPPLVDEPALFPRFLGVPEESGAHVVVLGGNQLLLAADCPLSAQLFRELGYEPVAVDISEFQKLEGCVTCLSVRLRGTPH